MLIDYVDFNINYDWSLYIESGKEGFRDTYNVKKRTIMLHTIIFDVGGTLVTSPNLFKTFNDFLYQITNIDFFNFIEKEFSMYYESETFYKIEDIFVLY